ncbi:MAG: HEPN domain-containing protein [Candidatus Levybacteria bacterium]|nr:HEPN domain-containing protein [Candidatus Levybacteria bacterium]
MSKTKSYIIYASLWNFDISFNEEEFQLVDFSIKRFKRVSISLDPNKLVSAGMSMNEVNFINTLMFLYESQENRDFPHFIITSELTFENDFEFSIADRKIKWLLTCLRLYGKGDVQGRYLSAIPKEHYRPESNPLDFDSYPGLVDKYILDNKNKFEIFTKKLDGLDDIIDSIAVDRFNISFRHYNSPNEKLLDLITSLEGLFNKSPFDVKFKIALRTAHLIYPDKSKKTQELYEFLLSAYNLRNKIVHGLPGIDGEDLIIKTAELLEIVREALIRAINLRSTGKIDLFKKANEESEKEMDKIILNT